MSNPLYIGWCSSGKNPHICSMHDFNSQVIDSMFQDIYPPEIWDTLLCIQVIKGEPNYQYSRDYIRNVPLKFTGKTKGHPFLIQNQTHFTLNGKYKNELESIKVIYIYEDLEKDNSKVTKYINQLKSR